MSIYPSWRRSAELDAKLNEYIQAQPINRERYWHDAEMHLQFNVLRDVLKRTDKALQDEGVAQRTRDCAAHRVLYGEPPTVRHERDPDLCGKIQIDPEAMARLADFRLPDLPDTSEGNQR